MFSLFGLFNFVVLVHSCWKILRIFKKRIVKMGCQRARDEWLNLCYRHYVCLIPFKWESSFSLCLHFKSHRICFLKLEKQLNKEERKEKYTDIKSFISFFSYNWHFFPLYLEWFCSFIHSFIRKMVIPIVTLYQFLQTNISFFPPIWWRPFSSVCNKIRCQRADIHLGNGNNSLSSNFTIMAEWLKVIVIFHFHN